MSWNAPWEWTESMARGDHIKVRRRGLLYAHHGIDLGDGTVAHYAEWGKYKGKKGGPHVVRSSMGDFFKGRNQKGGEPQKRTLPAGG